MSLVVCLDQMKPSGYRSMATSLHRLCLKLAYYCPIPLFTSTIHAPNGYMPYQHLILPPLDYKSVAHKSVISTSCACGIWLCCCAARQL